MDEIKQLKELGYVVFESTIPASITQEIENSLNQIDRHTIYSQDKTYTGSIINLFDRIPVHTISALIENSDVRRVVDAVLSDTCVLHSFNGVPLYADQTGLMTYFHRDSGRYIPGYNYFYNVFTAITDFTEVTGGTFVVPKSHLVEEKPSDEDIEKNKIQIHVPRGSVIIFNSNLYHASGINRTDKTRWGISTIYSRSFFKQQIDFAAGVDPHIANQLSERGRQLMGYYVRVPKSAAEYAFPPEKRLYRPGQG